MPGDGYLPPVVISIIADDKGFLATIAKDKALLIEFAKTPTELNLDFNTAEIEARLLATYKDIVVLGKTLPPPEIPVVPTVSPAELFAINKNITAMAKTLPPPDIPVDLHINTELFLASLDASIAMAKAEILMANLGSDMSGGGGGAGGAGGTAGAAAGGIWTFIHAAHLFMPEIIGFATALASVAIGFIALGVASIGAAVDIGKGYAAVSAAQNAISSAIPGTSQWTTGVANLGQAWSAIPTAIQPAVAAINKMMSGFGNSPMATEIQGFLGAQAGTIGSLLSNGGNTFAPLILATQRAMVTVEGIIKHAMGSGSLTHFVDSIAKMVGPATIELVQMAGAIAKIAAGFATAVQDGQGMEMIVNLLRSIGQIVSSSLFQGFIAGWVDFDRLLSVALGLVADAAGALSGLGVNLHGVGEVLGFVVSGLIAVKSAMFLMGKMGVGTAESMTQFGTTMTGVLTKTAGVGLLAVGITGLAGNVATLLHTSNPLTPLWNKIGEAIGLVSKAAGNSIDTIKGYKLQLQGSIPVTGQLSAAMDLLVRSEQSIGSALGGLVQGFRPLTLSALGAGTAISTVTDKVTAMISTLQGKNQSLASWAADAQILIKRGMDPSAVASLAQQAPQDLASMVTATNAQLTTMNVQWQEQMLLAQMSGQNGVNGFVTALKQGLTSGTPVVKAAAQALFGQLGKTLNIPFTGTTNSINQISAALNRIPASVLSTLAGKTGMYSAATTDAAAKTKITAASVGGLGGKLLSLASNLAMVGLGLKLMGLQLTLVKLGMIALSSVGILVVATGVYLLIQHFGVLRGLMIAGAAAVGILTIAFIALDAVPVVAIIVGIILALAGLVAGIIYVATHWKQIWKSITDAVVTAWNFLSGLFSSIPGKIMGAFAGAETWLYDIGRQIIAGLANGITGAIGTALSAAAHVGASVVGAVKHFFGIASPSVVFAGIGTNLMAGLAQGVAGSAGLAHGAMIGALTPMLPGGSLTQGMMGNRMGGMGGMTVTANFTILAPGGNAEAIKGVISKDAADAFAQQVLVSMHAGAGTLY